jgi:hypothetical protein
MNYFRNLLALVALTLATPSLAGVRAYNASGANLGSYASVFCSTGVTCDESGGKLRMRASPTYAAAPTFTIGDGTAEDIGFIYDGNAQDFIVGLDDSVDKLVISLGATLGTTNRMAFNSADLNIVLGDASAADVGFIYDGNAVDFNVSLDDSTDDLVIGVGSTAGTTDAIRVDGATQDVTFVQNVVGLGTDSVSGFLQKHVTATATTITAAQCGSTFKNAGAIEIELPEASTVVGCRLTFIVGNASAFTIDPDAADSVVLLTNAAGDSLIADAIGESMVIEAISASAWAPVGAVQGTWTDSD